MNAKLLILLVAVNTVGSHLLLKSAVTRLTKPASLDAIPGFLMSAALVPAVWASLALQVIGYLVWIVVISSEKLGIATAMVSASYYLLTASAAWIIFGERLSIMQWLGISLITLGVVCVTLATSR